MQRVNEAIKVLLLSGLLIILTCGAVFFSSLEGSISATLATAAPQTGNQPLPPERMDSLGDPLAATLNAALTRQIEPTATHPLVTITPTSTTEELECKHPSGWVKITLQPGDTLFRLSILYKLDVTELSKGNCIQETESLVAGKAFFVPELFTQTPTTTVSGSPTVTTQP